MKNKISIIAILMVSFLTGRSNAADIIENRHAVKFNSVYVAINKTTTLIFPTSVMGFTIGSPVINVVKVEGMETILHVKANIQNFSETNMTVVTIDGSIFSFRVNYSMTPLQLVFKYDSLPVNSTNPNDEEGSVTLKKSSTMEADVINTSDRLLVSKKKMILGVHDRNAGLSVKLIGLHKKNDLLYFKLECQNSSDETRIIDSIQYYIKDEFKNVLNVYQQAEVKPLMVSGNHSKIEAKSTQVFVVAIPKFVIPYLKYFAVEINEKDNDGKLLLKISNDLLEDAPVIDL